MGRLYIQHLSGEKIYKCKFCKVDSASYDDIVDREFMGRYGRGYLMRHMVNISIGPEEHRHLSTGLHIVNDIYCSSCQQIIGWRYEKAFEEREKRKEGMYLLEKERVVKDGW